MLSVQEGQPVSVSHRAPIIGHPWVALVVRSRHEKSVQQALEYKGYRTSVPLVRCIHKRRSGSDWDSQKPLITGYVFVLANPVNPSRIVTTPGFVKFVSLGNGPAAIPGEEIDALERIAASGLPVGSCCYTRIGEKVGIIDGPLKGIQGIVLREANAARLVVGVELLQRAITVEIEGAWAISLQ
jgi:transcription termination/antitermination protein NusG